VTSSGNKQQARGEEEKERKKKREGERETKKRFLFALIDTKILEVRGMSPFFCIN